MTSSAANLRSAAEFAILREFDLTTRDFRKSPTQENLSRCEDVMLARQWIHTRNDIEVETILTKMFHDFVSPDGPVNPMTIRPQVLIGAIAKLCRDQILVEHMNLLRESLRKPPRRGPISLDPKAGPKE